MEILNQMFIIQYNNRKERPDAVPLITAGLSFFPLFTFLLFRYSFLL